MLLPLFSWNLAWCKEKKIQTQLEHMSSGQLDAILRRFYAEARSKSGDDYSKSTLLGFRHSIERYLNAPPLNKGLKLSSDPRFKRSNEMLNAKVVSLKRHGKENVKHKPAIETEDLVRLKSSQVLSPSNPLGLLRNVWFHVILFFCRRGREGQRNLKKTSFKFEVDPTRRNYTTMAHDEASKNHPGGVGDIPSMEKYARMYETEDTNDGYKALKLYLTKLNPKCEAFFQYPRKNWSVEDNVWYEARPVGVNSLDSMMKNISEAASLSHPYTNHSLRATAITLWSNAGIPNRHIMAISGHRNEQSLAHYNTRPSTTQLRNCSDVLSRSFNTGNVSSQPESSAAPITVRQNNSVVVAQEKTASFLQSVFSNCTVHGSVNIILNNQNP